MLGRVRVAAWQAPLLETGSMAALGLIQHQIERCESEGVTVLCCPEAILGGLADSVDDPLAFAIPLDRLESVLAPLSSDTVTVIVGFTEAAAANRLYNAAAVFQRGAVTGVYRKQHPAINRSVYEAGSAAPVFRAGALVFGVIICNDSNFDEPARSMAAAGAQVMFVPTNNALPPSRGGAGLVGLARDADVALAAGNGMWVVRADVSGRNGPLESRGSSGIVAPGGTVVATASASGELVVAEIALAAN